MRTVLKTLQKWNFINEQEEQNNDTLPAKLLLTSIDLMHNCGNGRGPREKNFVHGKQTSGVKMVITD